MRAQKLITRTLALIPWSLRSRIKRIPGIAQLQRFVVSKSLDGQEFVHTVDAGPARGIAFHVRMPEDKGIWTGTYEHAFAGELARAVRPGMVTYDIGSWHGFFAGVMAAQGAGHVYVFEPLPQNAERVRRLIALNPEKPFVLKTCAVGENDAEMDLMIMPDTSMAKLESSTFQPEATPYTKIRVPVRSIDSMVDAGEIAPPSLIKLDVEGAELMVLRGARQTLQRHRPQIFGEIHSSRLLADCQLFLGDLGYAIHSLDQDHEAAKLRDVFQIRAVA